MQFELTQRRQEQTRRILYIIDVLAPMRYGATLADLQRELIERVGMEVGIYTLRRDVRILEALGLVERSIDYYNKAFSAAKYKLLLTETANLQRAAVQLVELDAKKKDSR